MLLSVSTGELHEKKMLSVKRRPSNKFLTNKMIYSLVWKEINILKYRKLHSIQFIVFDKYLLSFYKSIVKYKVRKQAYRNFECLLRNYFIWIRVEAKYFIWITELLTLDGAILNIIVLIFSNRGTLSLNRISIILFIKLNLWFIKCWQYNKDSAKKPWKEISEDESNTSFVWGRFNTICSTKYCN